MKTTQYKMLKVFSGAMIHCFLIATAITCLFPLFWMFRSSLMSLDTVFTDKSLIPATLNFSNYVRVWVDEGLGTYLINSVIYTVVAVAGIVFIASLAAFAFSRLKFPGRNFFFYMFVAAFMIPLPGSFVPLVVLVNKLGLADTRIGYILCMVNVGLSMSILLLKTFFDKIPPDLEDAARIEGCNKLGIWWYIALPLAKPAIAVVIIFNSLNIWNEYILAQLLLSEKSLMPLQTGLMKLYGAHSVDYPVLMAGLSIATLPVILVYLAMQKYVMKGFTYGTTGG